MSDVITVIWDYDGTLVDTRFKNLSVQKKLISQLTGKSEREFPALKSVSNYQIMQNEIINWQDQYKNYFGLTENQIHEAGRLWSQLQENDETDTPLYSGIISVLESLREIPQTIFSQNSKKQIQSVLTKYNLDGAFRIIIGFEELSSDEQKPSPVGLLKIIDAINHMHYGIVLFIGDHSTDFKCAENAKTHYSKIGKNIRVISVGVNYTPEHNSEKWSVFPHYVADKPKDILTIINKLST